ncbi:MAG: hypothetical protein QNJ32_23775 [Xenococcaceae cyanobacterium MO_167.B27]|nr:hypothetical protein [Xenococcaceae cyanobacterium MO_167.B27]
MNHPVILTDITQLVNKLDQRFSQLNERFNQLDRRLNQLDQRLDKIEYRLNNLEIAQADTKEEMTAYISKIDSEEKMFTIVESEMDSEEKIFPTVENQLPNFNQKISELNNREGEKSSLLRVLENPLKKIKSIWQK